MAFDLEKVIVDEVGVSAFEGGDETGILILHHLLDANVLDDVEHIERAVWQHLLEALDAVVWGVEGMSNFVADQQVRELLVANVPGRQTEDALLHIKEGRMVIANLDGDVLLGQEFGQHSLGGGVD